MSDVKMKCFKLSDRLLLKRQNDAQMTSDGVSEPYDPLRRWTSGSGKRSPEVTLCLSIRTLGYQQNWPLEA